MEETCRNRFLVLREAGSRARPELQSTGVMTSGCCLSRCTLCAYIGHYLVGRFGPLHSFTMGYFQAAMVKMGMAQPGPKITAQDRAILE